MPKGKPLGPRVTVEFAPAKKRTQGASQGSANARYVFMLKSTAEALGFKPVIGAGKTKKGATIDIRGSKGAGSIKVPVSGGGGVAANALAAGKQRFLSVPVPANATIAEIRAFLSKSSKKPETFVSPDGRTRSVVKKA